jgi:hypothetical protein
MDNNRVNEIEEDAIAGLRQMESAKQGLEQLEDEQQRNEMIANIPLEFNVASTTLRVTAKTIKRMVEIDRLILEMQKLAYLEIEAPADEDIFWNEVLEKTEKCYNLMAEIISKVVESNDGEITLDWVRENIDITEGGIGEKIIDAYNIKCSPTPLIKKILGSRKF